MLHGAIFAPVVAQLIASDMNIASDKSLLASDEYKPSCTVELATAVVHCISKLSIVALSKATNGIRQGLDIQQSIHEATTQQL